MKTVRLNLEDKQSWQKFQHVLTSFVSDYIDLVAPEQTEFKFERQTLHLTFILIAASPDRDRANYFTQNLENFLTRIQLIGVSRVDLEFFAAGTDAALLIYGFEVPFIKPEPIVAPPISAIARRPQSSNLQRSNPSAQRERNVLGGSLVRNLRGWLTNPQLIQTVKAGTKVALRNPKRVVAIAKTNIQEKASAALTWVDTFPWESWFKAKMQWQQRRHRRHMIKALIEDFVLVAVLAFALFWATDFLSGPSLNLAAMPAQHYDTAFANNSYRCGNPNVNKKNYVCLNRGMGYNQVTSILGSDGKPLGIDHKFGENAVIISWRNGEGTLNATFSEDKLVAKAYRNLP